MIRSVLKWIRDKVLLPRDNGIITYAYYLAGHRVRYVPLAVMACDMAEWAETLPHNIDVVVGIPRQGLIPAAIAALYLGKPLSTPDLILEGKYWQSDKIATGPIKRILLIDDSYASGYQFTKIYDSLRQKFEVIPAVPYAQGSWKFPIPPSKDCPYTTLFWTNLTHTPTILGTDLDGVLCEEPPHFKSDYGLELYYRDAKPKRIPTYEIEVIATGRRECHRRVTVNWLKKHGVKYKHLVMRTDGSILETKRDAIRKYKPRIFLESDPHEAKWLFAHTNCPVITP